LLPQLANSAVALIERRESTELSPVHAMTCIQAPLDKIVAMLAIPQRYAVIAPDMDRVEIVRQNMHGTVFKWQLKFGALALRGTSWTQVYSQTRTVGARRIEIRYLEGDLGGARVVWRIDPNQACPTKDSYSVAVSAVRDLRRGTYVAKSLADASRSMTRSATIALTLGTLLSLKQTVEGKTSHASKSPVAPHNLLDRGDMLWIENQGAALPRISVFSHVASLGQAQRVLTDEQALIHALTRSKHCKAQALAAQTYKWTISMPFFGSEGVVRIEQENGGQSTRVVATDGALKGGVWNFALTSPGGRTVLVAQATFDPRSSSAVANMLIAKEPFLGPSMAAASQVSVVRALSKRIDQMPLVGGAI